MDDFNFEDINSMEAALKALRLALERLPGPVRTTVEDSLDELEALLSNRRSPRLAIIGRRGSGKSSLINALCSRKVCEVGDVKATTGDTAWQTLEVPHGTLEILDTRGAQEGHKPSEETQDALAIDSFVRAMGERNPDAVLFLCKASEVDSAIDGDIAFLAEVCKRIRFDSSVQMPVVGIVSQCDQLPQPHDLKPPYRERKTQLIEKAQSLLLEKLKSASEFAGVITVLPVSAYCEYDPKTKKTVNDGDFRWNIGVLSELLAEKLPKDAQLIFIRVCMIRALQKKIATSIVVACSGLAAAFAATPLPFGDIGPLLGLQVLMVTAVAYVAGREMDFETGKALVKSLGAVGGAAWVAREVARGILKFVPIAGNIVSAAVAGATTYGLGVAAIAHLLEDASIDDARARGEDAAKDKKTELELVAS